MKKANSQPSGTLYGPFEQILTLDGLPMRGPLNDESLQIITKGGIVVENGIITMLGKFEELKPQAKKVNELGNHFVLMPAFVDSHTHICFAGSRAHDYAARISGKSYQEILQRGGGIYDTVNKTRQATEEELVDLMMERLDLQLDQGIGTCEVKSGYGLSVEQELKMLRAVKRANDQHKVDIVATCLAAHVLGPEYKQADAYLDMVVNDLLPVIAKEGLTNRIDAFVEPEAFSFEVTDRYFSKVRRAGFEVTVHADQFTSGGSELAVKYMASSADHLESSIEEDIARLGKSTVTATVLPGASLGLGMQYAPARKLLDAGCSLAIATDWNPGSAPMGDLLTQAALLSASEKLCAAETFAGMTFRAAKALGFTDRGVLAPGKRADMIAFSTNDYREILYHQGKLRPKLVWKDGSIVF
ncbi:MAG: imidazolonepropionase [Cyclobacteriaceae bacterium]